VVRALTFVVAAAVGYVLTRAAWIFLEWPGVVAVGVVIAASVWRRQMPIAVGLTAGAAASALALML
jgi:hypothetical protein